MNPDPRKGAPIGTGIRWPAEWEPHTGTWLSWPHNRETWSGAQLARVCAAYAQITRALQGAERVHINVASDAMEAAARRDLLAGGVELGRGVEFHRIPTDDAWIRDCGPIFTVRESGPAREVALLDFRFQSWGRKYPPWDRDDAVPRRVAEALALPCTAVDFVLEGGSIDGDGRGTILVTESCLLNPNRGTGRTRASVEAVLADTLGARSLLWLPGGIEGDDTDGHIDDVARFVADATVVAAVETQRGDPNCEGLEANLRRLRAMRTADGKPLAVVPLPMPPPLRVGGVRLPASYANFYLANGVALVPTFDSTSDARALDVLREVLPGREVVGIDCRDLVVGLGAIHCLTQQQPALD